MTEKEIMALACFLVFNVNTFIYVRLILRKEIKAHVFTWFIFFLTQGIASLAQFADGAGVGALPIFIGALYCLAIAGLAFFYHGERNITRSDWWAFLGALAAIPLWVATKNPLWAALLVTGIDAIGGYFPTFRKSWYEPEQESVFMFATGVASYAFAVLAVEHHSVTTLVYPSVIVLTNAALSIMLVMRRRVLSVVPVNEAVHG